MADENRPAQAAFGIWHVTYHHPSLSHNRLSEDQKAPTAARRTRMPPALGAFVRPLNPTLFYACTALRA